MAPRRRLDAELVRRGLAASRNDAQHAVEAGRVTVGGAPALKASRLVAPDEPVVVAGHRRYVSRGGDKLAAAIEHFGVDVDGWRALDAGASTGGFTDFLLQAGAAHVVAVDVGHGQLHQRLRDDERVEVHEGLNIRAAVASDIGDNFDIVVADLSFISLRTVASVLVSLARPSGTLLWLVKPQFEAGRAEVARGRGVVRDGAVRERVRVEIDDALTSLGATVHGWMDCPVHGPAGNVELFVHAAAPAMPDRAATNGGGR